MWNIVEALIPAVVSYPERASSVIELISELGKQCPGIQIRVVPQWRIEPDPKAAFTSIANGLSECSRPWILYLEDDAELVSDFGERAVKLLPLSDGIGALALFSPEPRDVSLFNAGCAQYESPRPFCWAQGILLRCSLAHAWADCLRVWTGHPRSPDNALTPAADKLGLRIMRVLPSLVQHRNNFKSSLGNHTRAKSPTFGL